MVQNGSSESAVPVTEDRSAIPVAAMVESIIGCKWSVRLLGLLADGCTRPSALLRACPGLSTKVMNERLRKMMRFGIVRRSVFGEKPPVEVEYLLTPLGRRFMRILEEVRRLQEAVDHGAIAECGDSREEAARSGRLTKR
jgi:DNA-binding HxlR family transcriptional regulator